jgi:hypothetical protein
MRGIGTRLSKLEAKRSPKADARFYVFGVDEDDAAERYAAEIRAGTIQRSNLCHTPTWRGAGPLPAPRWMTPSELNDEELEDAIAWLGARAGREPLPRGFDYEALTSELNAVCLDPASESGHGKSS